MSQNKRIKASETVRSRMHQSKYRFSRKNVFAAIAVLVTLIGWISSNYTVAATLNLLLATGFSGAYVIFQYRLIKRLIMELKDA